MELTRKKLYYKIREWNRTQFRMELTTRIIESFCSLSSHPMHVANEPNNQRVPRGVLTE